MKMKPIPYVIPRKYLEEEIRGTKPITVRAWETPVKGLIVQRPIAPTRRGEVHLTHKASGAILVFAIKGPKTAAEMARRLKRFPVNFTVPEPASLYRRFAKFSDRQVRDFRKITGMKGKVEPARWREFALRCARNFAEVARSWTGRRRKPAVQGGRKQGGKAWKVKKSR